MPRVAVVDIQGYSGLESKEKFTPKEVAIIFEDGKERNYYIKPVLPIDDLDERQKKIIFWATVKYHRLPYGGGNISEKEFEQEIIHDTADCDRIITKGRQKVKYLEKLLKRPVEDLTSSGCPTIRDAVSRECDWHIIERSRCSKAGAKFLKAWVDGQRNSTTSSQKAESPEQGEIPGGSLPC